MSKQVGGDHYAKHKIQPWHIIDEYDLNYYEGNVLKYLLRSKSNRVEDLHKAVHYLEKEIENLRTSEESSEEDEEAVGQVWVGDPLRRAQIGEDLEFLKRYNALSECSCSQPEIRPSGSSYPGYCNRCGGYAHQLP